MAKKVIDIETRISYSVGRVWSTESFEAVVAASKLTGMPVDIIFDHGFDVVGNIHIVLAAGKRRVNYQILVDSVDLDVLALSGAIKATTALWLTQKAEKLSESMEDLVFDE